MNLYIAPVKLSNSTLLARIRKALANIFHVQVEIIELKIDADIAYSPERRQYYSTQIISQAIDLSIGYDGKVILLTETDLYVPVLTFVFGEAQLRGKHSIISICRLHEEFYSGRTDDELLYQRALKEVLHELGHNFGLIHCLDWDCVMHSSLEIEEIDIKGDMYCRNCMEKTPIFDGSYK